jgi:hypothetical protein
LIRSPSGKARTARHECGRLTQASNPANYRGWTTRDVNVVTFFSEGTTHNGLRPAITSRATLDPERVQRRVADGRVAGLLLGQAPSSARTAIARTRRARTCWSPASAPIISARIHMRPIWTLALQLGQSARFDVKELETTTTQLERRRSRQPAAGAAGLPAAQRQSLLQRGENFQPLAGRIDAFRQGLPPPAGETEEYSVSCSRRRTRSTWCAPRSSRPA